MLVIVRLCVCACVCVCVSKYTSRSLFSSHPALPSSANLCAHIGLVPIKADPRKFEYSKDKDDRDETNYIVFRLKVKCEKRKDATPDASTPEELYVSCLGHLYVSTPHCTHGLRLWLGHLCVSTPHGLSFRPSICVKASL